MKISVVIPAKDEELRLPAFLKRGIEYCRHSKHSYEIIIVDDGSRDQTANLAKGFQKDFPALKVLSLGDNYGKGYAVKQGFLSAEGGIVLFLDADGSTDPEEIERHLAWFDQGYDIVIGSRVLNDGMTKVKARAHRRVMGSIFNLMVSHLLIHGIKDTQCGFKMFRSTVVPMVFGPLRLNGFGFDLEILYLAQKNHLRVKEVPVNWKHIDGSKVRLIRDSLRMIANILQIRQWHG